MAKSCLIWVSQAWFYRIGVRKLRFFGLYSSMVFLLIDYNYYVTFSLSESLKRIFMKGILAALLLTGLAAPALSSSVYLECRVDTDSGWIMQHFSVTLNVSTKKIEHKDEDGSLFQTSGVFTDDTVTYENTKDYETEEDESEGYISTNVRIDRMDLSVQTVIRKIFTTQLLKDQKLAPVTRYGRCELADAPKRAF
jgi:hypothetical protein